MTSGLLCVNRGQKSACHKRMTTKQQSHSGLKNKQEELYDEEEEEGEGMEKGDSLKQWALF